MDCTAPIPPTRYRAERVLDHRIQRRPTQRLSWEPVQQLPPQSGVDKICLIWHIGGTATGSGKPIIWVGSSLRDLQGFPREVQREVGYALYLAEIGKRHPNTKPLSGLRGVIEIVSDSKGSTYRVIYVTRLREHIYVLHAFQKKSHRGIATPRKEMATIRRRLSVAEQISEEDQHG